MDETAGVCGMLGRLAQVDAEAFADTLDGLAAALVLVEADGRSRYANQRGQRLLAAGEVIRITEGFLTASHPLADRALRCVLAAINRDDVVVGAKRIAVGLTAPDGTPFVAHVLPL